jgi:preprotein translocase subunit SecG
MILTILLTFIHVVVCLFLIIVVLLQSGKAADLSAAFGGQGSQTAFGPRGTATALSKATTFSAVAFMVTSLSLSILATRSGSSSPKTILDAPSGAQPAQPAGSIPKVDPSKPAAEVQINEGPKVAIPLPNAPTTGEAPKPAEPPKK